MHKKKRNGEGGEERLGSGTRSDKAIGVSGVNNIHTRRVVRFCQESVYEKELAVHAAHAF